MKLFFDTEFTGLTKDTTLISIAVIDEDGDMFYAECTDYNKDQVSPWIKENVIDNLIFDGRNMMEVSTSSVFISGPSDTVGEALINWLAKYDEVQFVSDVCHYDFMLLIDLISPTGCALDLPPNVSAVCHDINQDIAKHMGISDKEAFDVSREELVKDTIVNHCGIKHRASHDARVIHAIYTHVLTKD